MSGLVSVLVEDISKLLAGSIEYDLQIVVGEGPNTKTFDAHSLILRARSSFFNKILSAKQPCEVGKKLEIKKRNVTPYVFSIILGYMYTGTVSWEKMKRNDISAILASADELQLHELIDHIQQELIENQATYINHHLVDLYRTTSTLKSCQRLFKHCEKIITASPGLLFDAQDFTKLEREPFKSLLMQNDVAMPEIDIWEKVIAWGIANTTGLTADIDSWRKDDFLKLGSTLADILPLIHYVGISSTEFYHKVLPYRKLFPKSLFQEILQSHLDSEYDPSQGKLHPPRQQTQPSANQQFDSVLVNNNQVNWMVNHVKAAHKESFQEPDSNQVELKLLYRGTRDGFTAADFHKLCDYKKGTITVAKVAGTSELIGGYSPLSWNFNFGYHSSDQSFIFALGDHELNGAVFSPVKDDEQAICCNTMYGPVFGNNDLCIGNWKGNAFNAEQSCRAVQNSYSLPIRSSPSNFSIAEIEVFHVVF